MIPSKKNIFQTPEEYFDRLPDEIRQKYRQRQRTARISYWSAAASAVVVLGITLSILWNGSPESNVDLEANMQAEIEMYIGAGYWQAEDILAFVDNPDKLLDEIIKDEWGTENESDDQLEDLWF